MRCRLLLAAWAPSFLAAHAAQTATVAQTESVFMPRESVSTNFSAFDVDTNGFLDVLSSVNTNSGPFARVDTAVVALQPFDTSLGTLLDVRVEFDNSFGLTRKISATNQVGGDANINTGIANSCAFGFSTHPAIEFRLRCPEYRGVWIHRFCRTVDGSGRRPPTATTLACNAGTPSTSCEDSNAQSAVFPVGPFSLPLASFPPAFWLSTTLGRRILVGTAAS